VSRKSTNWTKAWIWPKKELTLRQSKDSATQRLNQFVNSKAPELSALKDDLKRAQYEYNECTQYFGENPKLLESSSVLFGAFAKFLKQYKSCLFENRLIQKKKMDALIQEKLQEQQKKRESQKLEDKEKEKSGVSGSGPGSGLAGQGQEVKVREKRLLKQDEVYNGALEDILLGLKSEPYRRADAVRRSQRRKAENVRLSHTEMDI
jgi:hypothetical protein